MKILLCLFIITLCTQACFAGKEAAKSHPNIVIILTDDMGYGDFACFNPDSKIPTPHIDRLAAEGMRFTDAHSPGALCHPTRYGLLTGRYPFRIDVTVWPTQPLIETGQMTLASLLSAEGYDTAMVGKWHIGFEERADETYDQALRGGPIDHGFDFFFGMRASTDIPPYFYIEGDRAVTPPVAHIEANDSPGWSPIQGAFWRAGGIAPELDLAEVMPRLTDAAVEVIEGREAAEENPLFLYLAYTAPHTPWLPSPEFEGKSGAGMYGDFMMMVDAEIGRVLAALDAAQLSDDTLVILTSDNGPVWYPQDVAKFGHSSTGPFRGMKGDAWEGGHRMPLIARWPERIAPGSQSAQTICFTDLLATFADICGVDLPPQAGPDSFSLLPVLDGRQPDDEPIRGPIVMQSGSVQAMVIRSGDWKLIDRPGSGGFSKSDAPDPGDPPGQLYNLREDPGETRNLYQQHPQRVADLNHQMEAIIASPTSHGR